MKLPGDYTALVRIPVPNTMVNGYQAGDDVPAPVVEAWELVIGEQVALNDTYQPPRPAEDSADRAAWESYVVGQGTDLDEARAASLDELRGMYDAPEEPEPAPADGTPGETTGATPEGEALPDPVDADQADTDSLQRPADSALKAEWVDYVKATGNEADATWAQESGTTKGDLIAWADGRA